MKLSFQINEFKGLNMNLSGVSIRFEGSLEDLHGTMALIKDLEQVADASFDQQVETELHNILGDMVHGKATKEEHPWDKEKKEGSTSQTKTVWGHKREAFDAKKESLKEVPAAEEKEEKEETVKEEAPKAQPAMDFFKGLGQKATQTNAPTDFKALFAGMVEKKDHLQK